MRADDDVFMQGEKLLNFLSRVNSKELYYIGQGGQGQRSERSKLFLSWNQNYCMGGPGMIMSQPLLQLLVSKIDHCLANLLSSHEDVEVGRCVTLATGQSCTWATEMRTLFYHRSGPADNPSLDIEPQKTSQRILNNAITFHPIKSSPNMELMRLLLQTKDRVSLLSTAQSLALKSRSKTKLKGSLTVKENLNDLAWSEEPWSLIYNKALHSVLKSRLHLKISTQLQEAIQQVLETINMNIKFRDINFAYVNEDFSFGMTYIFHLFKRSKKVKKSPKHVYVRQALLEPLVNSPVPLRKLTINQPGGHSCLLCPPYCLSPRSLIFCDICKLEVTLITLS